MDTLHIKNLEFWGTHGITGDEKEIAQPFGVDIGVQYNFVPAIKTDMLKHAIDYKVIEKIVKNQIEGSPRVLIERLADDIITAVFQYTTAHSVDISVSKNRAKSLGTPSVTMSRARPQPIVPVITAQLGFDSERIKKFYSPDSDGIIHLKGLLYTVLDKAKIKEWYAQKSELFEKKEEKYVQNTQEVTLVYNGPFGAMQTFDLPQEAALHNLYYKIRDEINKYSDVPFKQGDTLESKLIKYAPAKIGIGAHRDLSSNVNIVVIMNLYGTTMFYTASDKKRTNEKEYLIEPGDIMIMRGPRTASENALRPTHYVLDIAEERLALAFREIEDAQEARVNKDNWMSF